MTIVLRILDSVVEVQKAVENALGVEPEADEEADAKESTESFDPTDTQGWFPEPEADVEKQAHGAPLHDDEVAVPPRSSFQALANAINAFFAEEARAIADAEVSYDGPDGAVVHLPGDWTPVVASPVGTIHSPGSGSLVAYGPRGLAATGDSTIALLDLEDAYEDQPDCPSTFRSRRGVGNFRVMSMSQVVEDTKTSRLGSVREEGSPWKGLGAQGVNHKRPWSRTRKRSRGTTGDAVQGWAAPGRHQKAAMKLRRVPKWLIRRIRWAFPLVPLVTGYTVLSRWMHVYGEQLPKVCFQLT
jgi:hypothetical protein